MTLISVVTSIVEAQGEATIDTILPLMPSYLPGRKITRKQVKDALHNARYVGNIQLLRMGQRFRKGCEPGVFGPVGDEPEIRPRASKKGPMPVNSVFQMGDRALSN